MRLLDPLDDLVPCLRFGGCPYDLPVRFKHIRPESDFLLAWLVRSKPIAPPVGESLQPADNVIRFFRHSRRIFIIRSNQRVGHRIIRKIRMERILAGMVHRLSDRSRSFCNHRRLDFLLNRNTELGVLPHVIGSTVNTVGDGVLLRGIQREADIFFGIAAALMGRSRAVALKSHHRHAALVTGGIAAVRIKRPCGIRLVESAFRIVGLHGV